MPIILFNNNMNDIKAFGHDVTKVMAFGHQVWQKQSSIPDYLCFTALEAGQFTLTIPAAVTPTYLSYVEWSKDGRTWNHTDNTSEAVTIDVQVASGEKVYWMGSGKRTAVGYVDDQFSNFSSTCQFDLSGDIRSILYLNDFSVTTTNQRYCFTGLFYGASVVNASNLRLALTGNSAYMYCFRGCTQLLHAPALMEGNTIMQWQFHSTYDGCTNLVTGTDLQATSVGVRGCYYTYKSCTSLVKAPNISSITTIGNGGLCAMFHGCSSLTYIKCLATSLYDDGDASHFATYNWVAGVSSTGTFIQAEGVTWTRGASGIPTGWVDVEKRTMPSGYKQLLWVSTDSKAYVNTGIAGDNDNLKITTVFNMSAYIDWGAIYGNYVGDSYNVTRLVQGSSDACSCCNLNVKSNNSGNQLNYDVFHINRPHMVIQSKNSVIYNGTTINISGKARGTANSGHIALGNRSMTNPNTTRNIGLCIYTHKIEDTSLSSVLCDYVACVRESDSKAGFYDFVSNAFIPSATSSDFTAGEEI